MKRIQYMLTTPIKQQCADLAEWRILQYKCASLHLDKFCAYDSLIRFVNENQNPHDIRACVKRSENWQQFMSAPDDSFCKKFNPNNIMGACDEQNCPFYQRNNAFFNILKRYESAITARRDFWDNKMNQR